MISAGYQLNVTSWENDGDHYQTHSLDGLSEADVRFLVSIVTKFDKLGNSSVPGKKLLSIIKNALVAHPGISSKLRAEWTPDLEETDPEIIQEVAYGLICTLLGDTVDYVDEPFFCRMYSSHTIYYFKADVPEVNFNVKLTKPRASTHSLKVEQQVKNLADQVTTVDEYGTWTEQVWFSSPDQTALDERDYAIMALGLPGEVGEVTELLKKRVRDGTFDVEQLKKELGDVAYYWARLCKAFGLLPSEVLRGNVEKIESRRLRGTLRGSGDDR